MIERRRFLFGAASLAALPIAALPGAGSADGEVSALIHRYSNQARASLGLAPLRASPPLGRAAAAHALAMARTGALSHTAGGTTPVTRAREVGYRYRTLAENIGYRTTGRLDGDGMARYFVEAWLASPGHRRNLLNRDIRDTGIGVASDGRRLYAVQMLAARKG